MGLSLPKSNLIFLKKCLDKWVHFTSHKAKNVGVILSYTHSHVFSSITMGCE